MHDRVMAVLSYLKITMFLQQLIVEELKANVQGWPPGGSACMLANLQWCPSPDARTSAQSSPIQLGTYEYVEAQARMAQHPGSCSPHGTQVWW